MMQVIDTDFPEVKILSPRVFSDDRGFFKESWNEKRLNEILGENICFVQDNFSRSTFGVIRGLHYQYHNPQSKLVKVVNGRIIDVVVDIRKESNNFGKHITVELSAENHKQLWIPKGFAHGFCAISDVADVEYKVDEYFYKDDQQIILWKDDDLKIAWPALNTNPVLSERDTAGKNFSEALLFD